MKKISLLIMLLIAVNLLAQEHKIIPEPSELQKREGVFKFSPAKQSILSDSYLQFEASYLTDMLSSNFSIQAGVVTNEKLSNSIKLLVDESMTDREAYALEIDKNQIVIKGGSATGVFYGIQSLQQWMWGSYHAIENTVSCVKIIDKPKYEYRALMLDPARHFLKLEGLKQYVDVMAKYKYNRLHLHLSDDQGWRIEVKKYPLLTELGSVRKETEGDGVPHSGFYSQQDMKELVAYAAKRHVTIIPEIDVPGHSVAAIVAYPHLTCFDEELEVRTTPGVSKNLLCAGNDEVFTFLDDVIAELAEVFPGDEFHIGGDEAPLDHWKECPKCQKKLKSLGEDTPQYLMSYFFKRVNQSLQKNNKRPLIWYELDVPFYPENSTMYTWRMGLSSKVIKKSRKMGYKLISCPGEHAYFDYPQAKGEETCDWMPILSLEQVYQFNPAMGVKKSDHIIGVEASLWGEYVKDIERAFYMTWPRGMALAEAGWSGSQNRSWKDFTNKLNSHFKYFDRIGVAYRFPAEVFNTQKNKP
ncbi:beta-N-acetylhexosaminidase [Carboxylicivirga sediminis]|uniref:beta-N-acetylhexosaminidase n=1 Tax=Carboxylicivirga sediminis TaxID=2006564 RepID=A0A941IXV0_9BACT|nr:beta-N-acetylhexosaminidase [Carboxylicivirga sediminis]MBR8535888.1 beta-N-acetylhexosaminidase [Carboxylicivirga sediminis]